MDILSPTDARKNFYSILKKVNEDHRPVVIKGSKPNSDAVIISQDDWKSIEETLFLEQVGVMDEVRKREVDDSGYTDIDDIDWDNI